MIYLREFICDLSDNNCIIKMLIADNPKRAKARAALNHAALYACEYCFAKAASFHNIDPNVAERKKTLLRQKQTIDDQIASYLEGNEDDSDREIEIANLRSINEGIMASIRALSKKKTNLVWPSSTIDGEIRTKEKIEEIIRKIEEMDLCQETKQRE